MTADGSMMAAKSVMAAESVTDDGRLLDDGRVRDEPPNARGRPWKLVKPLKPRNMI